MPGIFVVFILVLKCLLLALIFLPTIVALHYNAENKTWIFLVNLIAGWTGLGWLVALFWALLEQYDVDLIEKIVEKLQS